MTGNCKDCGIEIEIRTHRLRCDACVKRKSITDAEQRRKSNVDTSRNYQREWAARKREDNKRHFRPCVVCGICVLKTVVPRPSCPECNPRAKFKAAAKKRATHPLRVLTSMSHCNRCELTKPSIEFDIQGKKRDGSLHLSSTCITCSGMDSKKAHTRKLHRSARRCTSCDTLRQPADFYSKLHICRVCIVRRSQTSARVLGKTHLAAKARERYHRCERTRLSIRRQQQMRRARKLGADSFDLSGEEWNRILEFYDHRCAYCFGAFRLEQDHVVPLTRGGNHSAGNIVPACRSCNASKNSRLVSEWLSGEIVSRGALCGIPAPRYRPRSNVGAKRRNAKLNDDLVRLIRREYSTGVKQKHLAKMAGVDQSIISEVINRKRWQHVLD